MSLSLDLLLANFDPVAAFTGRAITECALTATLSAERRADRQVL